MQYQDTDIAIVGMAGLYPQSETVDKFWSNILAKRDLVTESADDWLGIGDILDGEGAELTRIYTRRGGFLGDLARFNPIKHQTMPKSLVSAQPDQFVALKLAFDALIDAGLTPGKFDGTNTGVILGHSLHVHRGNMNGIQHAWINDQVVRVFRQVLPEIGEDKLQEIQKVLESKGEAAASEGIPGLVPNIMTGRIANRLDLMGPNYIIDAACSSSLIAVDHAITELRSGRADVMLAGGVNSTTSPLVYSVFCSVNALSREGLIRPFSTEANGTVLGEGAGILVLKRLKDAIKADDRIHAVLKGVGLSSDGKSSGLMAPRLEGEVLAVERAYRDTGIDPSTIGLLEAHGTGIPLGDQTEVKALQTVFGGRRGPLPTIPVGSVKSMIGHCIPASGSAAMIKLCMALKNKVVPPTLCDEVSEDLGLQDTPFYVSQETRPWTHSAQHPRRAAINAFGFGGINAHMILEEAPGNNFTDPTAAYVAPTVLADGREQVVAFAGATRDDLLGQVRAFGERLHGEQPFSELCAEAWAAASAGAGPMRLAIVAADAADYEKKIGGAIAKLESDKTTSMQTRGGVYFETKPTEGKVAFLFPGEMAQYPGMMLDVSLAYPAVREWFDFIGQLTETQRDVRIREVVFPPMNLVDQETQDHVTSLMHRVDYGSEIVFAADQAVFGLLSSLGIKADAMLGHSTGENAAIVASGIIDWDRDDVGKMIADMNTIFADVETSGVVPSGVLLTVAALDQSELMPLIEGDEDIHFTMDNCPNQSIVFGPKDKLDALEKQVVAKGAVCTRLPISWGYHTEFVRPMAERFGKLFESARMRKDSAVTLYSCSTGKPFPKTKKARIALAMEQYVTRVRFREAIENLYEDGHRIFVECGPNANLTAFVGDTLGRGKDYISIAADNPRRGMASQMRHVVARLFAAGRSPDAADFLNPPVDADRARRKIEGAEYLKAPALNAYLTTFVLEDDEAAHLHDLILPDIAGAAPVATPPAPQENTAPAQPAAAAQPPAPTAATQAAATQAAPAQAAPAQAAPAAQMPGQADQAMREHLSLMSQFVSAQGNVASSALQTPGLATAPSGYVPAPQTQRQQIQTIDLGRLMALPFDFSAYMLQGAPSYGAVSPYLGAQEHVQARALLETAKSQRAWTEWSLSRLAVKLAARDVLARTGQPQPQSNEMEILKADSGAPYLSAPGANGHAPAISISHVNQRGIGAAAAANWRVGVDFELPERLNDAAGFLETILSDRERQVVNPAETAHSAAALWSAKEAAAKALGVGIQGRPQAFEVTKMDESSGYLQIAHAGHIVDGRVQIVGNGVFAVAYYAATQ